MIFGKGQPFQQGGILPMPQQPGLEGLLGNPMLMAGLGLLSAGRDSRIDPYQAAAGGLSQAQQIRYLAEKRKREQEELKLRQQQVANQTARLTGPTPAQQNWEYAQGLSPEDRAMFLGGNRPSSVKEWEFFSSLSPDKQKQYLTMKRANQMVDLGGGGVGTLDPVAGGTNTVVDPQAATTREGNLSRTRAREGELGSQEGAAQADLPGAAMEVEATLEVIDKLRNHPGREMATGASNILGQYAPSGTDTRDFLTQLDQAKGKAFASAYQTLKGGGQITEIETEMATKALANLEAAQSEEQFLQALDEFERAVMRGYAKLQTKAGVKPESPVPEELTVPELLEKYGR